MSSALSLSIAMSSDCCWTLVLRASSSSLFDFGTAMTTFVSAILFTNSWFSKMASPYEGLSYEDEKRFGRMVSLQIRICIAFNPYFICFVLFRWVVIYPSYINARKTIGDGRRISKNKVSLPFGLSSSHHLQVYRKIHITLNA